MTNDEKNLDLLAIFHYVVGGITALFACIPMTHVAVGLVLIFGKFDNNPPPQFIGWLFVFLGGIFILFGWAMAVAIVIAARKLKNRMSWTYCIVVAALECMFMPFGTVLGVFTIIVLMKDPVKQLFLVQK
jgi:hypothetical protein